jgi:hypothetical protein
VLVSLGIQTRFNGQKHFRIRPRDLTDASLKTDAQKLPSFDGKFHRKFLVYLFTKTIDDHVGSIFGREPTLTAIINLVFANL